MMEINLRLYLTTSPCNSIDVLVTIKIFMPTTVAIRKKYVFFCLVLSPFRISWGVKRKPFSLPFFLLGLSVKARDQS
uniref:Uncharacterized protein n=1 Tax=Canis lupus dingo TaxID=286419 RepID=A0A8C0KN17_CANLU